MMMGGMVVLPLVPETKPGKKANYVIQNLLYLALFKMGHGQVLAPYRLFFKNETLSCIHHLLIPPSARKCIINIISLFPFIHHHAFIHTFSRSPPPFNPFA